MINKILLSLALLMSLIWIGYVSIDVLSDNKNYAPEALFGSEDGAVLIVNRPTETNVAQIESFAAAPMADLLSSLNSEGYTEGYLSASRPHLLLKNEATWNAESIQNLFKSAPNKLVINNGSFTYGEYAGRYYKKGLYLFKGELDNTEGSTSYAYDKKASASILHISENGEIDIVSDIYFKESGRVDYISYDAKITQGKQVKDESIFAAVVTNNFDEYHFYERDYYATVDSIFAEGPMSKWIMNGFLELTYNNSKVLICDYIDGQDPILILNDLDQTLDKETFNHTLSSNFPSKGNSYHVKYLEDLVVFSESLDACNAIIADFKLGNTIALNQDIRNKLYGSLPALVSERIVTKAYAYSKAVYQGRLLETQMGPATQTQTNPNKIERESIAMNCGFDISDFAIMNGSGNVIALGKNGEIKGFKDGSFSWESKLDESAVGGIQIIDLHQNNEQFILLNTSTKIHLWDLEGNPVSGFPISMEDEATNQVKFYCWKGKSYFLIANENNRIMHYDSKGRELNSIKCTISVTRKIDVWASQQKLFAGFANNSQFIMYNLDKSKVHREFALPTPCSAAKIPNELIQFGIKDSKLLKVNQKGLNFEYSSYPRSKIIKVQVDSKTPTVVLQSKNEIHLVNIEGISFCQISLPFNEVEDVFILTTDSGKTMVAIVDGLENNVYLYGLDGERISQKLLEGQTKVCLNTLNNNTLVTSIVDQYIVQYFE